MTDFAYFVYFLKQIKKDKRILQLQEIIQEKFTIRGAKKPTHVYGIEFGNVFHSCDFYRVKKAIKEGGIFLDLDTLILKSFNHLRKYEVRIKCF